MDDHGTVYENDSNNNGRMSTRTRNIWFGVIVLVVLVGLGYIFRPITSGTVAGVHTTTPYTPSTQTAPAPNQPVTGTLQGTVR